MDRPISKIAAIYNQTKKFHDEHIDHWGDSWDDGMKLPDIIRFSHWKWISFKNSSVNDRSDILDELANARNLEITKQIVRKILSTYGDILEFIKERRSDTPEDEVDHCSTEGIALELRQVLTETITIISEIMGEDSCFNSVKPEKRQKGPQRDCFETDKAKKLLEDLRNLGLIEKNGNDYTWKKTAILYGFFVDVSSIYLNLRSSNKRIPWRKYEKLFTNHSELLSSARSGVNVYNNGRQVKPDGHETILKLCKS